MDRTLFCIELAANKTTEINTCFESFREKLFKYQHNVLPQHEYYKYYTHFRSSKNEYEMHINQGTEKHK